MKKLNTSLSQEQATFVLLMEQHAPYLLPLWDFEKREYKAAAVESYLNLASHGEQIMARFFLCVWRNDNYFNFDLIEATNTLGQTELNVISAWVQSPVFP
jgi:hypothetical protein